MYSHLVPTFIPLIPQMFVIEIKIYTHVHLYTADMHMNKLDNILRILHLVGILFSLLYLC